MKDILLSDGDISFLNSDIQTAEACDELVQSVRSILSIRAGEFLMDETIGLSRENMLGKDFNEEYLKQDIAQAIQEQEPRIALVEDIVFSHSGRKLNIQLALTAQDGNQLEVIENVG